MKSSPDSPKPNGRALLPFLVFVAFYLGLSLQAGDFYKVPMPIAFVVASAAALCLGRPKTLEEKIDSYASSMGEPNIMIMCMVFILAGSFATIAKGSGAVDAAVAIARALVPARFLLAGMFLVSSLVSLAIGTSCGTIAALVPIAAGLVAPLGANPALMIGAVVGGAMFGDNLSLISDTTIAATRTQGIEMRAKFLANIRIALPAALATLVLYALLGRGTAELAADPIGWREWVLVTPYALVLLLALAGLNVMALLFGGTLLSAVLGIAFGKIGGWDALDLVGKGTLGMSETLVVALLAGGLLGLIRHNGGIDWLMEKIGATVHGVRGCELGVLLLVSAVNLFTANNTVAIIVAGPVAKSLSERFGAKDERVASILDTGSCILQGVIPYGAQLLMAVSLSAGAGVELGAFPLIGKLYYQGILLVAVLVAIALPRRRAA
jgi:Na+/H+ antiporter NhaC